MSESKFEVLLVDDEPLAREKLCHYLTQSPRFTVVGEAGSGAAAIELLSRTKPAVLFLDIQLPDMTGFDVLRNQAPAPDCLIIFITAYDQYALDAFGVQAFDYLVKPVSPVRFSKLLARIEQRLLDARDAAAAREIKRTAKQWADRVVCRNGSRSEIIATRDITYIEAARNYAVIHARGATHVVRRTLESIESSLDPKQFLRVSRSVIVNSGYIKAVEALSHGDRRIELTTGDALTWTRKYHREARIA